MSSTATSFQNQDQLDRFRSSLFATYNKQAALSRIEKSAAATSGIAGGLDMPLHPVERQGATIECALRVLESLDQGALACSSPETYAHVALLAWLSLPEDLTVPAVLAILRREDCL